MSFSAAPSSITDSPAGGLTLPNHGSYDLQNDNDGGVSGGGGGGGDREGRPQQPQPPLSQQKMKKQRIDGPDDVEKSVEAATVANSAAATNPPPVAFVETSTATESMADTAVAKQNALPLDMSVVSSDAGAGNTGLQGTTTEEKEGLGTTTTAKKENVASAIDAGDHRKSDCGGDDDRTSKDYYFDSYAHHAIHEEMLKDEVRTRTYEMAIMENKHLFQDKIVLDVGCGTGILAMFAARAGAKHVYAVDCSSIAVQARDIVRINGYADRITVIQGKLEEIELPVPQVDVIVSEWMGYFLLYESMLDTVIYARDKWLVEGGIVYPDKAVMYVAAVEDGQVKRERVDFWDNVYGFNMTPIKDIALTEPVVDVVDSRSVVTDAVQILHLDILTCTKEDAEFSSVFELTAKRNDYIHGLVAYFECAFTQIHKPIGFSTSPFARYTHWKQTIFYLPDTIAICEGEKIVGELNCRPNQKNRRDLDIAVDISVDAQNSKVNRTMNYRLR